MVAGFRLRIAVWGAAYLSAGLADPQLLSRNVQLAPHDLRPGERFRDIEIFRPGNMTQVFDYERLMQQFRGIQTELIEYRLNRFKSVVQIGVLE
jgi:hypothetical protein